MFNRALAAIRRFLKSLKLIDWAVIVAICGVVTALVIPGIPSGRSGTLTTSVRVQLFDAATGHPLAGARVWLLHRVGHPIYGDRQEIVAAARGDATLTDEQGVAQFHAAYNTEASDRHPESISLVWRDWVSVQTDTHGGTLIPLRYRPELTKHLKERGSVECVVGLYKTE